MNCGEVIVVKHVIEVYKIDVSTQGDVLTSRPVSTLGSSMTREPSSKPFSSKVPSWSCLPTQYNLSTTVKGRGCVIVSTQLISVIPMFNNRSLASDATLTFRDAEDIFGPLTLLASWRPTF